MYKSLNGGHKRLKRYVMLKIFARNGKAADGNSQISYNLTIALLSMKLQERIHGFHYLWSVMWWMINQAKCHRQY